MPVTTVRRVHDAPLDDPSEIVMALRSAGHSAGATRRAIIEAIHSQVDGFTADQLADRLGGVHLATVYRTLGLLEEFGVVRHIHLSHGPAVYERTAVAGSNRYLVCELCGRHVSVPTDVFASASRTIHRDHGFELHGSHFAIVGRCSACT
jgi:Fe2+ or Zn2+ uptake regulation protein